MIVGPSESMSKSKKNVIDPESMIKSYGADPLDGLYFQIVLQKKIFNGQIKVLMLLISFFKKYIIFVYEVKKGSEKNSNLDKNFDLKMNSYVNKITKMY